MRCRLLPAGRLAPAQDSGKASGRTLPLHENDASDRCHCLLPHIYIYICLHKSRVNVHRNMHAVVQAPLRCFINVMGKSLAPTPLLATACYPRRRSLNLLGSWWGRAASSSLVSVRARPRSPSLASASSWPPAWPLPSAQAARWALGLGLLVWRRPPAPAGGFGWPGADARFAGYKLRLE